MYQLSDLTYRLIVMWVFGKTELKVFILLMQTKRFPLKLLKIV